MGEATDPEEVTLQQVFVALLGERLNAVSKDALGGIIACIREIAECEDAGERAEIMKTMREILFPETIGRIILGAAGSFDMTEDLSEYARTIAVNLATTRRAVGVTQVELAAKSDVPQSHISRLEAGLHCPSPRMLRRLAQALGVPVADLDPEAAHGERRPVRRVLQYTCRTLDTRRPVGVTLTPRKWCADRDLGSPSSRN